MGLAQGYLGYVAALRFLKGAVPVRELLAFACCGGLDSSGVVQVLGALFKGLQLFAQVGVFTLQFFLLVAQFVQLLIELTLLCFQCVLYVELASL